MARLAIVLAALVAFATAGASPSDPPRAAAPPTAAEAGPASGSVDVATAHRLVAAGAKLVDVRTPEEFAQGHLAGAVNVPYDQMAARAAELGPPSTPVVLYCKSGRRSGIALETLRGLGYGKVWNAGGYEALAAGK